MRTPPRLDPEFPAAPIQKRLALLINPFYPKDPHASFGKHVLTPIAGADEHRRRDAAGLGGRVLGREPAAGTAAVRAVPAGRRDHRPPDVRRRAPTRWRGWYRARGAKVVLGGLHVLSCPEEAAPHADALAIGEGVQLWPRDPPRRRERARSQPVYRGDLPRAYRDDPPPRRDLLPRRSFLTTTSLIATRGCHNRCGFCYLATDGLRMPYQVRDVEQVVAEFRGDGQPYAVFVDNNLGSRPEYLRAALPRAAAAGEDLERRGDAST